LPILNARTPERDSRNVLLEAASNELVFAVVGHAGAGTSFIAGQLDNLLKQTSLAEVRFDVSILKAREVILDWARAHGKPPLNVTSPPSLQQVKILQDYGDLMRAEKTATGKEDLAAIARALSLKIRLLRAIRTNQVAEAGKAVVPDGKPRAYILDSLRHPEEAQFLRQLYGKAFVLIGVVCEEEKRITRITEKYSDGGRTDAMKFMKRDANAKERYGQHVADTFYLADYFVDNTMDRMKNGNANPDWDVVENLSRLVKIVSHSELVRPTVAETAMHHAYSAQMQSACLSRQVGAAVVDVNGNVVATGTNEVPKAGGGVYGESFDRDPYDARCAFLSEPNERYCRNTREQNKIIDELLDSVQGLLSDIEAVRDLSTERKATLALELRNTRIGGLLEFSRAVHAEMDALLSAARKGVSLVGTRLFVTTFPCHYCARHIIAAGVDEVQYIEPYPKSQALNLHKDAIAVENSGWVPPSQVETKQASQKRQEARVLFRPFSGVAPRLYKSAFMKDRELKKKDTGEMSIQEPLWGTPWHLPKKSPAEIEAELSKEVPDNA
jgi:deoxycytidylate deaminase